MTSLRILTADDVSQLTSQLSISQVLQAVWTSLSGYSHGQYDCPARLTTCHANYTSLHMPSTSSLGTVEKIVSVPSRKSDGGLPASVVVLHEETGKIKCLMNASKLTAIRTAAGSVLSSLMVIKLDEPTWQPRVLMVFGSGDQAYEHVKLHLDSISSLSRVIVVVRHRNKRYVEFIEALQRDYPEISFQGLDDAGQVKLEEVDIMCCCTPSTEALISLSALRMHSSRRIHITLIGSYKPSLRELDAETILQAERILVDSKSDCLREAGDLMDAVSAGLNAEDICELGTLEQPEFSQAKHILPPCKAIPSTGKRPMTIYKSVGISAMDNAIAQIVLSMAEKLQVGTVLDAY